MKCPFCSHQDDKVIDSRASNEGQNIRRRRECLKCHKRFTTYEAIEKVLLRVIKKDNRREPFDRNKMLNGVIRACEKRPVSMEKIESILDRIEKDLHQNFNREVKSREIGERVMDALYELDEVAYVRFASVYREFKDINHFLKALKGLLEEEKKGA